MKLQRTIRLRLRPDAEAAHLLEKTVHAYTASFNDVAKVGWDSGTHNGVELHKLTYYVQKAKTNLPSQLLVSSRMKATEALKSGKALAKKGKKVSCPQSQSFGIRYDARSYSIWFDKSEVSLLTLDGRVKLNFKVPKYYSEYITWKNTSADLVKDKKGRWWFNVCMQTIVPDGTPNGNAVGVDLGIVNPATDSEGNFYGSDHWKVVEERIFKLKRDLQAKGTKSAKRHLKKMSGRQKRFRKDCDHVLSKKLVHSVNPGDTLVFEDLTEVRGRAKASKVMRRRLHSWSFAQLQFFTEYKAEKRGVFVEYVDPRYTSQKCSQCSHVDKKNRQTQAGFACKSCGYENHADLNAALNIRANFLKSKGLPVNQPIVSKEVILSGTSSGL